MSRQLGRKPTPAIIANSKIRAAQRMIGDELQHYRVDLWAFRFYQVENETLLPTFPIMHDAQCRIITFCNRVNLHLHQLYAISIIQHRVYGMRGIPVFGFHACR